MFASRGATTGGAKVATTKPVKVRNGWRAPAGARVRLARTGEATEFKSLLAADVRNVQIEQGFLDGIDQGTIGKTVLERLRTGRAEDMHREVAARFTNGEPEAGVVGLAIALVVESRDRRRIGALLANPPCLVIAQAVDAGRPLAEVLRLAVRIVKIKAMYVEHDYRGRGIGTAMLKFVERVYGQIGVRLLYGQFRDDPQLVQFYRESGFEVLDRSTGVVLDEIGLPISIQPLEAERVFARWMP